ncbi:MAG: transposase family protein [Thermodesulfobacteriota bacterium]
MLLEHDGACYRAAGWQVLGQTRGYAKNNRHYRHHGQPKLVLAKPLVKDAVRHLTAPFPPSFLTSRKETPWTMESAALTLDSADGLMPLLQTLVDPRKPRGVRHPVATIVAIAVCAALSGARSFCAIAEWASELTPAALRLLGSKRREPPSEPTLFQDIAPPRAGRFSPRKRPRWIKVTAAWKNGRSGPARY